MTMIRAVYTVLLAIPAAFALVPLQAQENVAAQEWPAIREAAERAFYARDGERAGALFSRLVEGFPQDAEAWYGLSRAREWQGDLPGAIAAGERAQAIGYRSRASLAYRIATLYARTGDREEALDWLQRALDARYEDRPAIQDDEAFADLTDDPRFRELAGIPPESIDERHAGLRFDVDYLVEEARRMHADPDRPAFGDAFTLAADRLAASIPERTDTEVYLELMRLVAMLGDGHSAIYGPQPDTPLELSGGTLPLKFYWFDEGLYVTHDLRPEPELAGHRVLRFGEISVDRLLGDMSGLRGVDNAMTWRWMGPQFYVGQALLLEAFGAAREDGDVDVTLQDRNGETLVRSVTPGDQRVERKLRPSPAATGDVPLYLANVGDNFWMRDLPDSGMLYLQFNQVRDKDDQTLAEFADALGDRLDSSGARVLVVDVRHNNGGNNGLLRPLINTLIAFERDDPDNRLFVITGRNTFSAAQNFINRVERATSAIFVGEPSSSSPNFTGEETNLLLPYSRVFGSISTRYWQDSTPDDERPWIVPDIPVTPTAADYFAGRDAALEAILAYLER